MQIEGKNVLVTGASRGLGAALVSAALEEGAAKVYATARNPDDLPHQDDPRVVPLRLDITDPDQIRAAAEQAPDVDLLINNAGQLEGHDLLDDTLHAHRAAMETNYFGPLMVTRAFAPILKQRPEAGIVNILALLSLGNMRAKGGYCASKAAAWSLTSGLRALLAGDDIGVFSVFPGAMDTAMMEGSKVKKTPPEEVAHQILAGVRADREDIAPDPMSQKLLPMFAQDPKGFERMVAKW